MSLTKVEMDALADIVQAQIIQRQRAAKELGTSINTKFLEELLVKLGGSPPGKQGWQLGGCRRPE